MDGTKLCRDIPGTDLQRDRKQLPSGPTQRCSASLAFFCTLVLILYHGSLGEDSCEVSNSEDAYEARRQSYISLCAGPPSPVHSDIQQLSVW